MTVPHRAVLLWLAGLLCYAAETWTPIGLSGGGAMFGPAISPVDPQRMLVHCDMSAAYRSEDGGHTWTMIPANQLHVRWQARGGPCVLENGIALCPLHHAFLDYGIWGLSDRREILVSSMATGPAVEEHLLRFHGRGLQGPQKGQPMVSADHIRWHLEVVFNKPERAA